jgi:hypothetical protein
MYDETIKTKETKTERDATGTKTEERETKTEQKTKFEEPEKHETVVIEDED